MPWIAHIADKAFDLDDLPFERWERVEKVSGFGWSDIYENTKPKGGGALLQGRAGFANAVIKEVAEHLGVEAPVLTIRNIASVFEFSLKANIPEGFAEGIPDPKAPASDPVTT